MFFKRKKSKGGNLFSPACGRVKELSLVEDPVFSRGTMGQGFAVEPESQTVCAPVSGEVTTLFPGGHAIGITAEDGAEVLVHIGIDTVKLNGAGFVSHVKVGDRVRQGDKISTADLGRIQSAGFKCDVICVVTSGEKCSPCSPFDSPVTHKTHVMTYLPK